MLSANSPVGYFLHIFLHWPHLLWALKHVLSDLIISGQGESPSVIKFQRALETHYDPVTYPAPLSEQHSCSLSFLKKKRLKLWGTKRYFGFFRLSIAKKNATKGMHIQCQKGDIRNCIKRLDLCEAWSFCDSVFSICFLKHPWSKPDLKKVIWNHISDLIVFISWHCSSLSR